MSEIDTIKTDMEKALAAEQAAVAAIERSGPTIDVINSSTVVPTNEFERVVAALQVQVSRDYAPAWGKSATLNIDPAKRNPRNWQVVILDNADQAGALGYHDLTDNGYPLGKVFAKTAMDAGDSWSVTASHELLEMLGDPDINLTVFVEMAGGGRLYAFENADACEDDSFGYLIDGVLVSDFVFPAWFQSFWAQGTTQFDMMRRINRPFELLPGGYIGIYDIKSGGGWQQLTAEKVNRRARAPIGSRRERRRTPREQWTKSTA